MMKTVLSLFIFSLSSTAIAGPIDYKACFAIAGVMCDCDNPIRVACVSKDMLPEEGYIAYETAPRGSVFTIHLENIETSIVLGENAIPEIGSYLMGYIKGTPVMEKAVKEQLKDKLPAEDIKKLLAKGYYRLTTFEVKKDTKLYEKADARD